MATPKKLTLPVAFVTYEYIKEAGDRVPVGVVIVTNEDVKAYGLNTSAVGSMVNIYADRPDEETADDRLKFAENYRSNAAVGGGYGITTDEVRYSGADRAKVDEALKSVMDANADLILKKPKDDKKQASE